MLFCVHRGSRQIGGNCIELQADGKRLLLDLGLPLDAEFASAGLLPQVSGLLNEDPSLLGIVISHGHRDHWGLLPFVRQDIPLYMGAATERIMKAAANFMRDGFAPVAATHLCDGHRLTIGPFSVQAYLVDHSGFDAYAMLVEAEGKRLFYSGDLRAHGRKGTLFERLLLTPPQRVDVMLMEGSSLGRLADDEVFPTEAELEEDFFALCQKTPGAVLVACSAQNIDRVVTVYRATKRSGRQLIVDAYAAEILKAAGHASIPKPSAGWSDVKVFVPQRQRILLKRQRLASFVDSYRGRRIWPENLAEAAPRSVFLLRRWMLAELNSLGALSGASAVWSQWHGYLEAGDGKAFRDEVLHLGIPFKQIHTSGHASPADLRRLAVAIGARRLVPIHTFQPEKYAEIFDNVVPAKDGEWQAVDTT